MSRRSLAVAIATSLALPGALAAPALARNPHCAGGIQYVVQGMRDKDKGNTEDYMRQMNKAVQQLEQCASEDAEDFEGMGYLGWAYAEIDSAGPAGIWFAKSIAGLAAKGDKKKLDVVSTNRESYWAKAFNDGIRLIQDATAAYPEFSKPPTDDEKPLKEEAQKKYDQAIVVLTRAKLLRPGDPRTIRNVATAYALQGRFTEAQAVLVNGMNEAGPDSAASLQDALRNVRANVASELLQAKKYDEAIAYYGELAKAEPTNSDHLMGMASALFNRAATKENAARKADFKASAEAYAKAFALKSSDADLAFNAALAYQNAGESALAETQWRAALKARPDDVDAMSSLGSTLADLQKYDEAIRVLNEAIGLKPENKILYRQLGAVYSKAGNAPKSTELLTVYLAMNSGHPAADPAGAAKAAKAGSPAANTLAAMGTPEQVLDWETDGRKLQTWIYLKKRAGFTFDAGAGMGLVQKSDWSASTSAAAGTKK